MLHRRWPRWIGLFIGLMVIAGGLMGVEPAPVTLAASPGCVTVYTNTNYTGTSGTLCAGTYDSTTLNSQGLFLTVSSFQLGANTSITLCAYADCSHVPMISFTSDVPNLGSYTCGATPYCGATWDNANRWIIVEPVVGSLPDLETRSERINSLAPYYAGQVISVCAQARNYDVGAAGASAIGFWVATTTTQTPIDPNLKGLLAVPPLPSNGNAIIECTSMTIPANLVPGAYRIVVESDTNRQVAESNETDNIYMLPLTISAPPSPTATATNTPTATATNTPTNTATNTPTNTATNTPVLDSLTITIRPGWQIIALPLVTANTFIEAALSPIAGSYDQAYAADRTLSTIGPTTGLWVHGTQATSLTIKGRYPANATLRLAQGWNLVGFPIRYARPPTEILATLGTTFDQVLSYPATGWQTYLPAGGAGNTLNQIEPGQGYWIHMTEAATLTITNP